MSVNSNLDAGGLMAGASLLSRPAEEFENDPSLELMWAKKAYEHAEIYFNILCSCNPRILKLTPSDEEIYSVFRIQFPNLRIDVVDEDEMKSPAGKEIWRNFCEHFKDKIEDYSFGTLLRLNTNYDYSEENTTLVPRIQFLAIELARCREGYNDNIRNQFRRLREDKEKGDR